MDEMTLEDYEEQCDINRSTVKEMLELAKSYNKVNNIMKIKYIIFYYKIICI